MELFKMNCLVMAFVFLPNKVHIYMTVQIKMSATELSRPFLILGFHVAGSSQAFFVFCLCFRLSEYLRNLTCTDWSKCSG